MAYAAALTLTLTLTLTQNLTLTLDAQIPEGIRCSVQHTQQAPQCICVCAAGTRPSGSVSGGRPPRRRTTTRARRPSPRRTTSACRSTGCTDSRSCASSSGRRSRRRRRCTGTIHACTGMCILLTCVACVYFSCTDMCILLIMCMACSGMCHRPDWRPRCRHRQEWLMAIRRRHRRELCANALQPVDNQSHTHATRRSQYAFGAQSAVHTAHATASCARAHAGGRTSSARSRRQRPPSSRRRSTPSSAPSSTP